MIKLIFATPYFTETTDNAGHRLTICRLESSIVDTSTGETIARNAFSGVSKCALDDKYDQKLGKDLAISRAKYKNYKNAYEYARYNIADSIKWNIFICYMDMYLQREKNHEAFLLGKEEMPVHSLIRRNILAQIESLLPLLHSDIEGPIFS